MQPPIIDWESLFLAEQTARMAAEREVDRLEQSVTYWKAEFLRLQKVIDQFAPKTGTCQRCGKPFEQQQAGRKRVFCSASCREMDSRENRRYRRPPTGRTLTEILSTSGGIDL